MGRKLLLLAALGSVILAIAGCSLCEDSLATGTTIVTIHNFPSERSIAAITVTVSANDMETEQHTFTTWPTSAEFVVPAGSTRTFAVTLEVAASDPSVARAYDGSGTVDVIEDQVTTIDIWLELSQARILVTDRWNERLVQIDDMTGAGWKTIMAGGLGIVEPFTPYDVDLDQQGRIYVSVHESYTSGGIYRFDSMQATSAEPILENRGVTAIAVDRRNNLLYYVADLSDAWILYKQDLGDLLSSPEMLDDGIELELWNVAGIAVDPDGKLYLADASSPQVIQYDPNQAEGSRVLDSYAMPDSVIPWDVIFRDGYVYASLYDRPGIARIDPSTGVVSAFGAAPADYDLPVQAEFYGPRRFASFAGSSIVVTDETISPGEYDRIVSFSDMSGANWQSFGASGSLSGEFFLFERPPS